MFFIIYKTVNNINGKYYIGAHKTDNKNDEYLGSGILLKKAVKKHGSNNFTKIILKECSTEIEMYEEESKFIKKCLNDKNCYNLNAGGKGGWNYVNSTGMHKGKNNPMHVKKYKEKCLKSCQITKNKDPQKYIDIANENLKKAVQSNTGKKRPEHSRIMKKISKNIWKNNKEKMKNSMNSWFEIFPPNQPSFKTNRMGDFCKQNNIPYNSLWKTTIENRKLTKGKAAGWYAKKI